MHFIRKNTDKPNAQSTPLTQRRASEWLIVPTDVQSPYQYHDSNDKFFMIYTRTEQEVSHNLYQSTINR